LLQINGKKRKKRKTKNKNKQIKEKMIKNFENKKAKTTKHSIETRHDSLNLQNVGVEGLGATVGHGFDLCSFLFY